MGTRADFYVDNRGDMTWLASMFKDAHPWNIPIIVLAQVNPTMFAEHLFDWLDESAIDYQDTEWPWPWEDSRLTDYSYIMDDERGKVVAYSMKEKIIFDPLIVSVGEDLKTAKIASAVPNFPRLGVGYGPESSKAIQRIRKLFKLPKLPSRS
jgi:hypothetical protein